MDRAGAALGGRRALRVDHPNDELYVLTPSPRPAGVARENYNEVAGQTIQDMCKDCSACIANSEPDTEIDWVAYMQQVRQYIAGERDYTLIKGDTGPLVYPAGHVYAYRALYELTQEGTNILFAQCIFAGIYIVNEALAMWCYYEAEACSLVQTMYCPGQPL